MSKATLFLSTIALIVSSATVVQAVSFTANSPADCEDVCHGTFGFDNIEDARQCCELARSKLEPYPLIENTYAPTMSPTQDTNSEQQRGGSRGSGRTNGVLANCQYDFGIADKKFVEVRYSTEDSPIEECVNCGMVVSAGDDQCQVEGFDVIGDDSAAASSTTIVTTLAAVFAFGMAFMAI